MGFGSEVTDEKGEEEGEHEDGVQQQTEHAFAEEAGAGWLLLARRLLAQRGQLVKILFKCYKYYLKCCTG
jgi:hypothetical protein